MLQFFRKYQKFFFIFITIIIVCTFVFFGTYQALAPALQRHESDEVMFKSLDGSKIRKSYLTSMERFLNSESWMVSQRPISENYLNDGVISKDFLDSGLEFALLPYLSDKFKTELSEKLVKEKEYVPYVHAFAPQLSALSIWNLFAPEIPEKLSLWKNFQRADEKSAFEARVALFLAQKKFPPSFLSQVIRYQQREYLSFGADPRLMKDDLGLFNYHFISDWFGEEFMDGVCRSIIQTAALARKKGYRVVKGEALAELLASSQRMYETLREKCDLPVSNGYGLFQLYLRQNGWDEQTVVRIWEDVTLFRKYLSSVGNGALVDLLAVQNFFAFAHENISLELYQLPKEFRFQTMEDLKRFEAYVEAVGQRRPSLLNLPEDYRELTEIEKRAPELVGKKYRLFVADVDTESLTAKVSVKETWDWEIEALNWEVLKKEFPELAQREGDPLEILEKIDHKTRKRVDTFARKQIVKKRPEWPLEILKEKSMDEKEIFLTTVSDHPLKGIVDSAAFEKALDEKDEWVGYTQDNDRFYRILVQERSNKTILSFKEALKKGVLDACAERLKVEEICSEIVSALSAKYPTFAKGDSKEKLEKLLPFRFVSVLEKKGKKEKPLSVQWQVEKKEKTITRSDPSFLSFEEVLALEQGAYSKVLVHPNEGAYYVRVLERKMDSSIPLDKVAESQEFLAKEVKRNFFENLLKEIAKG